MRRRSRAIWLAAALAAVLANLAQAPVWTFAEDFRLGLDFIETSTVAPPGYWSPLWPPDIDPDEFTYSFEPYPLTDPSTRFVTNGALAGWTEEAARREIALRTEDAFRAIDTGDPSTTVRVAVYPTMVPTSLPGRRLNVAMAEASNPVWSPWGQQVNAPQDGYTAAVYLDEIDTEPLLTYHTADDVFNAVAGTTAHELGHFFGAAHVPPGDTEPFPLMAVELVEERLTVRQFGSQAAALILSGAGTANRADFDFSDFIDGQDITTLIINFNRRDALFHEADSNGDHIVDGQDITALITNFSGNAKVSNVASASAEYNPTTGEFAVSVDSVMSWTIRSEAQFIHADPGVLGGALPADDGWSLLSANENTIGEGRFDGPISYADVSLGRLAAPGTAAEQFVLEYVGTYGAEPQIGAIHIVPEPHAVATALTALLALMIYRRRCRRRG